jgi:hypothetical protein
METSQFVDPDTAAGGFTTPETVNVINEFASNIAVILAKHAS